MKQSCNSATIQFYVSEKLSKDREGFDNKSERMKRELWKNVNIPK